MTPTRTAPDPKALPPPVPTNLGKDEIARVAAATSEAIGYQLGHVLLALVEDRLGGELVLLDVDSWLADNSRRIDVRGPGDFTIYTSRVAGLLRQRFSIARDLGSYVLHGRMGQVPMSAGRKSECERCDWESIWFGACLLMPEDLFRKAVADGASEDRLTAIFLVSPNAVRVRKKSLGLPQ